MANALYTQRELATQLHKARHGTEPSDYALNRIVYDMNHQGLTEQKVLQRIDQLNVPQNGASANGSGGNGSTGKSIRDSFKPQGHGLQARIENGPR